MDSLPKKLPRWAKDGRQNPHRGTGPSVAGMILRSGLVVLSVQESFEPMLKQTNRNLDLVLLWYPATRPNDHGETYTEVALGD